MKLDMTAQNRSPTRRIARIVSAGVARFEEEEKRTYSSSFE